MLKVTIISVGKLKEKYLLMAIDEYSKRLSKYIKLTHVEILDEKAPEKLSAAEEEQVRKKEGERILKSIQEDAYVIALAIEGKQLASEELAGFLDTAMIQGSSHITFVIGGSIGLSKAVTGRANYLLSFSKMTFPHQLMRVILLEQIYRSFRILSNEPYHK